MTFKQFRNYYFKCVAIMFVIGTALTGIVFAGFAVADMIEDYKYSPEVRFKTEKKQLDETNEK